MDPNAADQTGYAQSPDYRGDGGSRGPVTGTDLTNPVVDSANAVINQANAAGPGFQFPSSEPIPSSNPMPEMTNPEETAAQRLKRLRALRMGLASTIKTSSQGVESSPLVSAPVVTAGLKGKLGQ